MIMKDMIAKMMTSRLKKNPKQKLEEAASMNISMTGDDAGLASWTVDGNDAKRWNGSQSRRRYANAYEKRY